MESVNLIKNLHLNVLPEKIFNHYLSDIDLRKDYSNLYYLDNSEKNNVIIPKESQKVLIK